MNSNQKKVTVLLFGGLGNQLFQYFAGLATASAMNATLCLRPVKQSVFRQLNQDTGIAAIDFQGSMKKSILPTKVQERILRMFLNSSGDISQMQKLGEKRKWIVNDIDLEMLSRNEPRNLLLVGYFQDLKYINFLKNAGLEIDLSLKNYSPWFLTLKIEAKKSNPIIIHIRRGDYAKFQNTIGLLDFKYYLSAINGIPSFSKNEKEVWIFSDSISEAKDFLAFTGIPLENSRIIEPPADSTEAESLILMSYGSALVTSNSTFSWWSAFLSRHASPIIVPKKWFKGLKDPTNLKQIHWKQMDSIWKTEI